MNLVETRTIEQLTKLRRYARRWGGDLLFCNEKDYEKRFLSPGNGRAKMGYYEAPFTSGSLGLQWTQKLIALIPGEDTNIVGVIHEMGHVFANRRTPNISSEFPWLGWEWVMAERVGLTKEEWQKQNADYLVDEEPWNHDIGYLSPTLLSSLIRNRIAHGKKIGIISPGGAPLSIRG